eukprot:g4266.t1
MNANRLFAAFWLSVFFLCTISNLPLPTLSSTSFPLRKNDDTRICDGALGDCSCDVEAVEGANSKVLYEILEDLTNTTYFRLFRVNLDRRCHFWKSPGEEEKIEHSCSGPPDEEEDSVKSSSLFGFGEKEKKSSSPPLCSISSSDESEEFVPFTSIMGNPVDRSHTLLENESIAPERSEDCDGEVESRQSVSSIGGDFFWNDMCKHIPTNVTEYVNLKKNEERFTGYNGSHVWNAIYQENCFSEASKRGHHLSGSHEDNEGALCYEERILYRMLSGMHTSTNTHVAMSAKYVPKTKQWLPKPELFWKNFGENPERLRNMHFAFVVMLRAVKRATPLLRNHDVSVGNVQEDERTKKLFDFLLDAHIFNECSSVFDAFDESTLFEKNRLENNHLHLREQFKNVFHNISMAVDCVACHKCKLHAKLQLLGIGTAFKILLTPEKLLSQLTFAREEVVALINTVAKFSSAIKGASDLAHMYVSSLVGKTVDISSAKEEYSKTQAAKSISSESKKFVPQQNINVDLQSDFAMDTAIRVISSVAKTKGGEKFSQSEEETLVESVLLYRFPEILSLAKHFGSVPSTFVRHARRWLQGGGLVRAKAFNSLANSDSNGPNLQGEGKTVTPIIVVGGGLAGLTSTVKLIDSGYDVTLLEKSNFLGGNSAKASSGINGIDSSSAGFGDNEEVFLNDMLRGGGLISGVNDTLAQVLTSRSGDALGFLRERVGLTLDKRGQLGGHSKARTHRPSDGMSGVEMILHLEKIVKNWIKEQESNNISNRGRITLMKRTSMTGLLTNDDGSIRGVSFEKRVKGKNGEVESGELLASQVILATGGYAADRTDSSLLKKYSPALLKYGTTNGDWATGDGHKLAMKIGAEGVEMDFVQVHPTGFIDPKKPNHSVKTLCAELLRGVGGILLDSRGKRFVNELGTRDHITSRMTEEAANGYGRVGGMGFTILLNAAAAAEADKHVPLYTKKGLLQRFDSLQEFASWIGVSEDLLLESLTSYDNFAKAGSRDPFGKTVFNNPGYVGSPHYYAGTVTPVLHYCMGGLRVNENGRVLKSDGKSISGLYAAGEIVGGIHGKNRLGGNALTEAVVFGSVCAETVTKDASKLVNFKVNDAEAVYPTSRKEIEIVTDKDDSSWKTRIISEEELKQHNSEGSCWVVLYGKVYDFTDFLEDHPAGPDAILHLGGSDGTDRYQDVHTEALLEDFTPLGIFTK